MKRPADAPLLDPRVLRVITRAPHAYLTIEAATGPHVTPMLFAITATRLWFVMERTTLKVRVLRQRPAVGIVVDGGRFAVVAGAGASGAGLADAAGAARRPRPLGSGLRQRRRRLGAARPRRGAARGSGKPVPRRVTRQGTDRQARHPPARARAHHRRRRRRAR